MVHAVALVLAGFAGGVVLTALVAFHVIGVLHAMAVEAVDGPAAFVRSVTRSAHPQGKLRR